MSRQQVYYTEVWPQPQLFSVYHLPPLVSFFFNYGPKRVIKSRIEQFVLRQFIFLLWLKQSQDEKANMVDILNILYLALFYLSGSWGNLDCYTAYVEIFHTP